jgi:hypothetical protein
MMPSLPGGGEKAGGRVEAVSQKTSSPRSLFAFAKEGGRLEIFYRIAVLYIA